MSQIENGIWKTQEVVITASSTITVLPVNRNRRLLSLVNNSDTDLNIILTNTNGADVSLVLKASSEFSPSIAPVNEVKIENTVGVDKNIIIQTIGD